MTDPNALARITPGRRRTARLDVVVDREPDGYTATTVFLNGVQIPTGAALTIHTVDPGAGDRDCTWARELLNVPANTPQAVRRLLTELVHGYHECDSCSATPGG